jgi:hypothetical protein
LTVSQLQPGSRVVTSDAIDIEPRPGVPGELVLGDPSSGERVALVRMETRPALGPDRPSLLARLLGAPRTVRRAVVRGEEGGPPWLELQHLPPVFTEVVRIYDAQGQLRGRCISHFKTTLRGGFRIADPAGATVASLGTASGDERPLRWADSDRVVGTIVRRPLGGEPSNGWRVVAGAGLSDDPDGRLFLLAAALTAAFAEAGWPA